MHNGAAALRGPPRSSVEAVRPAITKAKWRAFGREEAHSIGGSGHPWEDRGGSTQSVSARDASGLSNANVFAILERKGLLRSLHPMGSMLTAEALAYDTGPR